MYPRVRNCDTLRDVCRDFHSREGRQCSQFGAVSVRESLPTRDDRVASRFCRRLPFLRDVNYRTEMSVPTMARRVDARHAVEIKLKFPDESPTSPESNGISRTTFDREGVSFSKLLLCPLLLRNGHFVHTEKYYSTAEKSDFSVYFPSLKQYLSSTCPQGILLDFLDLKYTS